MDYNRLLGLRSFIHQTKQNLLSDQKRNFNRKKRNFDSLPRGFDFNNNNKSNNFYNEKFRK